MGVSFWVELGAGISPKVPNCEYRRNSLDIIKCKILELRDPQIRGI